MKKNKSKFIILTLCVFLLTGCAKTLTDENKKVVKYSASIICDSCTSSCDKEDNDCLKKCETKCNEAKKNQTGQNLTKNILCQPTNKDVIEIYEKYGVSMKNIPTCPKLSIVSDYEGLWVSLFVKPLAWIIIKTGLLLKNYGLSLVIISILIRAVLMPLTKKTAMQSENLKKAQPELDRLNKKYENKNDKDSQLQKSQETLLIYQKYGINPMSSCLFALIQIPLLFAFIEHYASRCSRMLLGITLRNYTINSIKKWTMVLFTCNYNTCCDNIFIIEFKQRSRGTWRRYTKANEYDE